MRTYARMDRRTDIRKLPVPFHNPGTAPKYGWLRSAEKLQEVVFYKRRRNSCYYCPFRGTSTV
jgi:hypothetical protein